MIYLSTDAGLKHHPASVAYRLRRQGENGDFRIALQKILLLENDQAMAPIMMF